MNTNTNLTRRPLLFATLALFLQAAHLCGQVTGAADLPPAVETSSPAETESSPAGQASVFNPEMVFVIGGTYDMGCTNEQEPGCLDNEFPVHSVTVPDFYLGKYEITRTQWKMFKPDPSFFTGNSSSCPVERVSWYDALVFCNWASRQDSYAPCYFTDPGLTQEFGYNGSTYSLPQANVDFTIYWDNTANGYRLPTEAEWEYAARGGGLCRGLRFAGSNDINAVAWYSGNSGIPFTPNIGGKGTHPVGGKMPNELGLFDMNGNVWEWCFDYDSVDYTAAQSCSPVGLNPDIRRIGRSGSWFTDMEPALIAARGGYPPTAKVTNLGIRLARTP